ncbi:HNH endonuclease [Paenibacillus sp. NFR01]|uniref:HNH endonuclease n=1 Tax=Paenibacillus sp. NFR01 TaxID=1566279 RepID=UPI000B86DBE6|nr:HNH endonuclease [Paenibacillus sp. NFR01]
MNEHSLTETKQCAYCHEIKPLSQFRRRTGKRAKGSTRRGACRECRKQRAAKPAEPAALEQQRGKTAPPAVAGAAKPVETKQIRPRPDKRRKHTVQPGQRPEPGDATALIPSAKGMILMRGHSDKGRRWHQEIDLELAVTLVREHAAVVINRRTIKRLYSNKDFRTMILERDRYICYFCGLYGDTIDHLLPRAKGGHTTPDNCVCACNLCNQSKADRSVEDFMRRK